MSVYRIHFNEPYKHARHYLGYSGNLSQRLAQHRAGCGARLMEVIPDAGISWVLARTWEGGHDMEARLKAFHSGVRRCPICKEQQIIEQLFGLKPHEVENLFTGIEDMEGS